MTTSFRHERIIRQAANFVAIVRAQIESDITDTEILEELERERRYLREQPRTKQYNAILKAIRLLEPKLTTVKEVEGGYGSDWAVDIINGMELE